MQTIFTRTSNKIIHNKNPINSNNSFKNPGKELLTDTIKHISYNQIKTDRSHYHK